MFLHKFFPLPIPLLIVIGGVVSGIVGLGMGYLTLRLRGAFFAIATLALAVVLQTLVVNWDLCRRLARRLRDPRRTTIQLFGIRSIHRISVPADAGAGGDRARRWRAAIERSQLGFGFATIRDDELAAEASGVPTLRLKLIATTISGALWAWPARRSPITSAICSRLRRFGLEYAVNSIAMPMIGGTDELGRPLIGAILLGTLQQVATVTISSAVNLLIVGLLLVAFVIIAPNGIVGLVQDACVAEEQMTALLHSAHRQALWRVRRARRHRSEVQPGERLGLIGPNGSGK